MNTAIGFIAKPLGIFLGWLYSILGSYGLAIVVFSIIVKLVLYPLYAKQIMSSAGMSKVQPKMKEIQNKYRDDQQMMNQKLAELYKEEGINPMGGCLPLIVQMPILFGLFALLRNPLYYMGSSESMMVAVHESFLWMADLSQPDKWILPILAGIATYFSFSMNQTTMGGAQNSTADMMKSMKYIFPIMIVLMGRTFPSGLTIYWALSQVIQIFYILRIKHVREKAEKGGKKKIKGRK